MIFTSDTKRQVKRYISYNYTPPLHQLPSSDRPAAEILARKAGRLIIPLVVRENEGELGPFIQIMILFR